MKLTNYERETIVNLNEGEDVASVYTHSPKLRRRLNKLSADRPEECQLRSVSQDGQAAEYFVPKSWIKVSPPRIASAAQKEAAIAALQKIRGK